MSWSARVSFRLGSVADLGDDERFDTRVLAAALEHQDEPSALVRGC